VLVVSAAGLSDRLAVNAAGLFAGLAIAVMIARVDQHATARLLPTGSYTLKSRLGSIYVCIALLSLGITVEVFVPYFLQIIHGYTPLIAGYLTALMAGGWTIGSLISSSRSMATADRLIRTGPFISALSLVALAVLMPLAQLTRASAGGWWLAASLLGVGMGIGLCWPHLLTRVFKSAPAGQESIASSAITTVQLYAISMGAALTGMVANAAGFTNPGGVAGAQYAAAILFAVFAVAPGLAILATRGAVRRADPIAPATS